MLSKKAFSFQRANRQSRFSQNQPFLRSVTSRPQCGHLPITIREGRRTSASRTASYVPTRERIIPVISSMKLSGEYSPFSIRSSFSSQSAVMEGDWICSGITVIRAVPFAVAQRYFVFLSPRRSTKPFCTSFSMVAARVAGVPIPFRSTSSGNSSALAASIACNNVSSVNRRGGVVFPSRTSAPRSGRVLPSLISGRGCNSFFFPFSFRFLRWTPFHPCSRTTFPLAVNSLPAQSKAATVSA